MGLDAVELVMRVEEEFGIEIVDAEAGEVATVGNLHHLVMSKLTSEHEGICLTSTAFYRTRKALTKVLKIPKQRISPATPLNDLVDEENRAQIWASIRNAITLETPDLETAWINYGNRYHSGAETIGELAQKVMVLNYKRLSADRKGQSAKDVWKRLCAVVVKELGVRPEQLTRDAHFVRDLKIDRTGEAGTCLEQHRPLTRSQSWHREAKTSLPTSQTSSWLCARRSAPTRRGPKQPARFDDTDAAHHHRQRDLQQVRRRPSRRHAQR